MIRIPSTLRAIIALTCSNCLLSSKFEMFSSTSQPLALAFSRMISRPETQNGETRLSNSSATVLPCWALTRMGRPRVPAASRLPMVKSRRVARMLPISLTGPFRPCCIIIIPCGQTAARPSRTGGVLEFAVELVRTGEMHGHGARGTFRVARGDALEDRGVLLDGEALRAVQAHEP